MSKKTRVSYSHFLPITPGATISPALLAFYEDCSQLADEVRRQRAAKAEAEVRSNSTVLED